MPVRIAISMGDYNGIGPEIILKTLQKTNFEEITPVIFGHLSVFNHYSSSKEIATGSINVISKAKEIQDGAINIVHCVPSEELLVEPGTFSKHAGLCAMYAVEEGIHWCMNHHTSALVTAPISKEAINRAGYHVPGHTEFLAKKTATEKYMMLLVHNNLRVGLVTIHIPVSQIAGNVTSAAILERIHTMHQTLKTDFNINQPKIALLGLNPHAGDGGVIGREEIEVIRPTIVKAETEGIKVSGPYPADGFFGNHKYKEFDGVLAMYHDQGLVPFKTLSFGGGVNVTAGLPIVRTSPDHGTAFDIAGQDKANPSSFAEALNLAVSLSKNRLQKQY